MLQLEGPKAVRLQQWLTCVSTEARQGKLLCKIHIVLIYILTM
jgi:hypothetical protein